MTSEEETSSLTLEKLKVHDRLSSVETEVKLLTQSINNQRENFARLIEALGDTLKRHEKILIGNGDGIVGEVKKSEGLQDVLRRHFDEDKDLFNLHNDRLVRLERIMWAGFGGFAVIEFVFKYMR